MNSHPDHPAEASLNLLREMIETTEAILVELADQQIEVATKEAHKILKVRIESGWCLADWSGARNADVILTDIDPFHDSCIEAEANAVKTCQEFIRAGRAGEARMVRKLEQWQERFTKVADKLGEVHDNLMTVTAMLVFDVVGAVRLQAQIEEPHGLSKDEIVKRRCTLAAKWKAEGATRPQIRNRLHEDYPELVEGFYRDQPADSTIHDWIKKGHASQHEAPADAPTV